jgi:hypothetical protein
MLPGLDPDGYSSWDDLLAGSITAGYPVTMQTTYDQYVDLVEAHLSSLGALSQIQPRFIGGHLYWSNYPCLCDQEEWVDAVPAIPGTPYIPAVPTIPAVPYQAATPGTPGTPTIPAVDDIPYSPYVPAVPGVPEIPYLPGTPTIPGIPAIPAVPPTDPIEAESWVNGYCEEVTTFPSNGEYSSLYLCEETCVIPQTWNCEIAIPVNYPDNVDGSVPVSYCDEVFDGTGQWTSLTTCEENCIAGCMDPNALNYNANATVDDGSCEYPEPPSYTCSGELGVSMLDGTLIAPWTCFDPGTGTGTYLTYGDCLYNCVEPDIMVGPCIINDATMYMGNSSYALGDVVNFMGFYYTAGIQMPALSPNPGDIGNDWIPCEPNYAGPCNLDANVIEYDNTIAYDQGTIIEYTNYMNNLVYYYSLEDVPSNHWATPGLGDSVGGDYDTLTETTNPWMPCAGNLPDIGGCDVDSYMIYDDNVTYDLNNLSQVNPITNTIVVWYQGNFWFLDCENMTNQLTGPCCYMNYDDYGTTYPISSSGPGNTQSAIQDGMFDCFTQGITGIPPGQLIQDENGVDIPGTGYWVQCDQFGGGVDAYQGCCDDTLYDYGWSLYGSLITPCMSDPLCDCAPSLCGTGSCFAKGDKVEMFDGTLKAIELIKVGDEVKSIKNNKVVKGIVTDSLIHPTNDVVEVIKINGITSEPDHPIFVNGKWVAAKTLGNISNEFIGNWYNLEIDGNIEDSEHNYIIGDLIVSGLGDNIKLNSKYQRQPKRLTEYLNL